MKTYRKILLSVCLLTVLTGCGSSKYSLTESSNSSVMYEQEQSYADADFNSVGTANNSDSTYSNADNSLTSAAPTSDQSSEEIIKNYNMIIRNANISVDVTDLDTFTSGITAKVNEYGGYFESTNTENYESDYSTERYGNYVIRLPQEKLDKFLDGVEQSGKITSKAVTSEDVSLQYVDIEAKIDALKNERDSLSEMMKKADNIDTLLSVEQALSNVNYEIDSFERQRRTLKNQVSYSTVRITAREERNVEHPIRLALEVNLKERVIEAIGETADTAVNIITAIPLILIFIVFITFILWIIKKLWTKVLFGKRKGKENRVKYVLMPMVNIPPEDKNKTGPEVPSKEKAITEPDSSKKEETI